MHIQDHMIFVFNSLYYKITSHNNKLLFSRQISRIVLQLSVPSPQSIEGDTILIPEQKI